MSKHTAKILICAPSDQRASSLAQAVAFLERWTDLAVAGSYPRNLGVYNLLLWDGAGGIEALRPVLQGLSPQCHVVVLTSDLDVRMVAQFMQDRRVSHFLCTPWERNDLQIVVDKLATGEICGIKRHLPPDAEAYCQRVNTYTERCQALSDIEKLAKRYGLRSQTRRAAGLLAEELLMNAMYQAPVDNQGVRVFADTAPNDRIRLETPRAVSLLIAFRAGSFYICVRDRFGTFLREDLARCTLRCTTEKMQIEQKKLGAGLGLYSIASAATRFIVNVIPGQLAEFICVVDPPGSEGARLKVLSVTTQRTLSDR